MAQVPAVIELSSLDGSNGFQINGEAAGDNTGFSVSAAGDVNGDGFADIIIGAPKADPHDPSSGSAYVVFGNASGFAANFNLSTLDGTNGFQINGEVGGDNAGLSVASAGDVNDDGFADLIIGAPFADAIGDASGASYVIFGKASGFAANLELSGLGGGGLKIDGEALGDQSGYSVSSAGDVNGDGFSDLIVGSLHADPNGADSGAAYVIFGKPSFAANFVLGTLIGTNGFQINGELEDDFAGNSVASAGDVNGDGFDDLVIGALYADPNGTDSGAAYVVFGKALGFAATLELSSLDGTNGFQINGDVQGDAAGYSVSSAGDINGDGFDDIIVGAPLGDTNGGASGVSYVVFGKASGFAATFELESLDGTNGFAINGEIAGDRSGQTVSAAGDFNGDGFADLIVSAYQADPNGVSSGAAYLVYGKKSGFAPDLDLSDLDGAGGFQISGEAGGDLAGNSVSRAGDVNKDGFADLLIGALLADPNGASSGASYVLFGKPSTMPANLNLSTLTGSNGFQINGEVAGDVSGFSVAGAGDVNGDGLPDLLIGAPDSDPNGVSSGASYVVFGKNSGFGATLALASLNGSDGFQINGKAAGDRSGFSVASAGDVNRDGFADLIVGASSADPNGTSSGATYVVFGKASGFSANFELSALDGTNGFQINGEAANDLSGGAVASAGDVNGDGFADLVVGAMTAAPNGAASGATYVVFGKATGFAATLELSSLDGTNGFQVNGADSGDRAGASVASAGDFNNDGFSDVIIGAHTTDSNGASSGAAYIVFGKASGFSANLDVSTLNGLNGLKISGEAPGDYAGYSVSSAGDVNGDGFADVIIGAQGGDVSATDSGAAYVVFGSAASSPNLNFSSLDGTNGFQVNGEAANDFAGFSVSSAGDFNGDGFSDLLVSAYRADPNGSGSGAAYVVFGKASGFGSALDLSSLNGLTGFQVNGEIAGDLAGNSVAAAGDLNRDGFSDLIIGALLADPNGSASGASYVVYGRPSSPTVDRTGSAAAQTLAGADFNDVLSGLGGNDQLFGHRGNDALTGGHGIDTARFAGLSASYAIARNGTVTITGPEGRDTLSGIEKAQFDDQTVILGQGPRIFDFNTDLSADLLWQNDSGQAAVWLMNGTTFTTGSGVGPNPGPTWKVKGAGDFDGDGHADILWQSDDGTPVIWFMNGTTFVAGGQAGFNPGVAWKVKAAGDFNGDGKADILWQNTDGTPAIWLMNGTTLLSGAAFQNPGATWHAIGTGDFNGDTKSDILWQSDSGQAGIWLMDGTSITVGGTVGLNPGATWDVRAAGDFSGDGKSDILWQADDGTPVIWFMDGTNFVSGAQAAFNPGAAWQVKGAGDFDGNGKADISWQHTDGTPAVWLMNGSSLVSGAAFINPGTTWHVLAMGS